MKRTHRFRSAGAARLFVLATVGAASLMFAGEAMAQTSRKDRGWGAPPTIPPPTAAKSNIVPLLTAVGLGLAMIGVQFVGSKRTHQD